MSLDLENLLRDWPHEAGQIKVRKIRGDDGREKLQMRLDLGLIQMTLEGRPDGQRPHGFASLLEYHQHRSREAEDLGEAYVLTEDDFAEIQQEAIQFYHRYVALFQLEDYEGVVRDTGHNLQLFDLMERFSDREEAAFSLQQVRPYVIMMNTRARALIRLRENDHAAAIAQIEEGIEAITEFYDAQGDLELAGKSQELSFLTEWLDEVRGNKPRSRIEVLEQEMNAAIADEAYEKAAQLRDEIRAQRRAE